MIAPHMQHVVDAPLDEQAQSERGVYNAHLAHLIGQLERMEPWPVPHVNERYDWSCGCWFRYLAGDWRRQHTCRRHRHSTLATGEEVGL